MKNGSGEEQKMNICRYFFHKRAVISKNLFMDGLGFSLIFRSQVLQERFFKRKEKYVTFSDINKYFCIF